MNIFADSSARYNAESASCKKMLEEKTLDIEQVEADIQKVNAECASLEAQLEDEKSGRDARLSQNRGTLLVQ
jgi:cell division protein FtsB